MIGIYCLSKSRLLCFRQCTLYLINAIYRLDYEVGNNADFMITLAEGWNLISSPYAPEERDIESIFRRLSVRRNLIIAKDYFGHFYLPGTFNNIPFWDVNQGYQVKLNSGDRLWITGEEVEADRPIPLPEGWSMVSYFPAADVEAEVAFESITDQLIRVKDEDGNFYAPQWEFNNIPPLHRGEGYQVMTSEEVELVWNVEDDRQAGQQVVQPDPIHFVAVPPTGRNMSVLILEIQNSKYKTQNSQIAAFNSDGLLVGVGWAGGVARKVAGGDAYATGLAVWGDDPLTDEVDGLLDGEAFELRYWEADKKIEINLSPQALHAGRGLEYETDGFIALDVRPRLEIPEEFYLSQNYPNPFNAATRIQFGLPEAVRITVGVYDVSGRLVEILLDSELPAGHHQTIWNANAVPAGMYLVRMEAGEFSALRKVILLR